VSPRGVPPPNYTQAPNVLFDDLICDPKLSLAELKVILVVVRQTIGFHNDEEKLTFSELETRTGLSRSAVSDGVQRAMARGIVERRIEGPKGHEEAFYALNISGSEFLPLAVVDSNRQRSPIPTASGSESQPPLCIGERNQKETPHSPPRGALKEDWEKVLEQLVDVVPGMTIDAFRLHLSIAERRGDVLVLSSSNDTTAGWTRRSFLPQIEAAAAAVFGGSVTVELPESETEHQRELAEELRRRRPPRARRGFAR
jgi:phage replication O-like protein O